MSTRTAATPEDYALAKAAVDYRLSVVATQDNRLELAAAHRRAAEAWATVWAVATGRADGELDYSSEGEVIGATVRQQPPIVFTPAFHDSIASGRYFDGWPQTTRRALRLPPARVPARSGSGRS